MAVLTSGDSVLGLEIQDFYKDMYKDKLSGDTKVSFRVSTDGFSGVSEEFSNYKDLSAFLKMLEGMYDETRVDAYLIDMEYGSSIKVILGEEGIFDFSGVVQNINWQKLEFDFVADKADVLDFINGLKAELETIRV